MFETIITLGLNIIFLIVAAIVIGNFLFDRQIKKTVSTWVRIPISLLASVFVIFLFVNSVNGLFYDANDNRHSTETENQSKLELEEEVDSETEVKDHVNIKTEIEADVSEPN